MQKKRKVQLKWLDADVSNYKALTAKSREQIELFKNFTYAADYGRLLPRKSAMLQWIDDCVRNYDQVSSNDCAIDAASNILFS